MTDIDPIPRTLRDAADPALAPGAAERIAEGAWERARRTRGAPPARFRILRRFAVPAVAAALLAGAVLALRGTDPAFAVDGDPVMVRRGAQWVETRDVPVDALVRVPEGVRALVSAAGDVVRPRPGSRFRCLARRNESGAFFRIEFDEGGAEVAGSGVVVALRDQVLFEPDRRAAAARFSFALDAAGAARLEVASGRAHARALDSGDSLWLAATERAEFVRGAAGVRGGKGLLARRELWTSEAPTRLTQDGFSFLDADLDAKGGLRLVGGLTARGFVVLDVPPDAVCDALPFLNKLPSIRVRVDAARTAPVRRVVHEKDGARIEALIDGCGGVTVVQGADVRRYPSVAAFRSAAPSDAALFGDALDD